MSKYHPNDLKLSDAIVRRLAEPFGRKSERSGSCNKFPRV